MKCPHCDCKPVVKNGITSSSGKQNYLCKTCGRQFVEDPEHYHIDQRKIELVDRLLLERISLAGIARAVEVSESWLQQYVNDKYAQVPRHVVLTPKKKAV